MKVYLLRHGRTRGNEEHRYVGRTDEPLTKQARESLRAKGAAAEGIVRPDVLYVSPLLRCRETAGILFPGQEQIVVDALRECDFGEFEDMNYVELNGRPDYQRFLDSGGECGFPGGETKREFQDRCVGGFLGVIAPELERQSDRQLFFVVHGGTIMAILDRFSDPHRDYYDWQTGNGSGYAAEVSWDKGTGRLTLEHIAEINE
ncbi:MAG: histidine phosphatase family protein [Lachnospiraceae bacterium]|nr:histidine phosphatase family protein [Lachnospiraceae bacterium]